jgi:prepilin-type N-terminal cleavage/methylation domain-containing protein
MFQRFQEMKERDERGFTLIELLVVVLIIAILAAIAIPVFLRQREKAYVADAQSTLRNWATAVESCATLWGGDYTSAAAPAGQQCDVVADVRAREGAKNAPTQTVTLPASTTTSYCIRVVESRLGANTAAHPWQTSILSTNSAFANNGKPDPTDNCP